MSSWHSYPKIYALGHAALTALLDGQVVVQEKYDGCVVPSTPILTSTLEYKEAGSLKIGDSLIGFNDTTNDPRLCYSYVTHTVPIRKKCQRLMFDDNRTVIASIDHPWLVRGRSNNLKVYKATDKLQVGDILVGLPLWQKDTSWLAGWLAGMYDGEGSLVKSNSARILSIYQKAGPELNLITTILKEHGFKYSLDIRRRKKNWKDMGSITIRGGWPEVIRCLAIFRPQRLINLADTKGWLDAPTNGMLAPRLVSKENVGTRIVTGLSTSSQTYIAAGMLCHNSQFSFGLHHGELRFRSKGQELDQDHPVAMFRDAITAVQAMPPLCEGWTYRCEWVPKLKSNALTYGRVPSQGLVLYDINYTEEGYLDPRAIQAEAQRLGIDTAQLIYDGPGQAINKDSLDTWLKTPSSLDAPFIEGIVIKNYTQFGKDKKALMGKFVCEQFKEVHKEKWGQDKQTKGSTLEQLEKEYKTEARWTKAIQHLRERGLLLEDPKDIGNLIQEIRRDLLEEEGEVIKARLFREFQKDILTRVTRGFPDWYKKQLAERQFTRPQ